MTVENLDYKLFDSRLQHKFIKWLHIIIHQQLFFRVVGIVVIIIMIMIIWIKMCSFFKFIPVVCIFDLLLHQHPFYTSHHLVIPIESEIVSSIILYYIILYYIGNCKVGWKSVHTIHLNKIGNKRQNDRMSSFIPKIQITLYHHSLPFHI